MTSTTDTTRSLKTRFIAAITPVFLAATSVMTLIPGPEPEGGKNELLRKSANLPTDHAPSHRSVAVELGFLDAGQRHTEVTGDKLILTPSALFFQAHAVNRVRIGFGMALDEIAVLRDVPRARRERLR